jgi:hypothetical protein
MTKAHLTPPPQPTQPPKGAVGRLSTRLFISLHGPPSLPFPRLPGRLSPGGGGDKQGIGGGGVGEKG